MDHGWTDKHYAACVPDSLLLYYGYTTRRTMLYDHGFPCTVRTLSMEIVNDRCLALHPPLDRRQRLDLTSTSAALTHTHDRMRGIENAEMILSRDYGDTTK